MILKKLEMGKYTSNLFPIIIGHNVFLTQTGIPICHNFTNKNWLCFFEKLSLSWICSVKLNCTFGFKEFLVVKQEKK